jgi:hypothetical protein
MSIAGNNAGDTQKEQSQEYTETYGNEAERRVASYTFWLDILTGALAVSTLGLWVAAVTGPESKRETLAVQSQSPREPLMPQKKLIA